MADYDAPSFQVEPADFYHGGEYWGDSSPWHDMPPWSGSHPHWDCPPVMPPWGSHMERPMHMHPMHWEKYHMTREIYHMVRHMYEMMERMCR